MCTIEKALPYVALAVACPATYEALVRQKLAQWAGVSKDLLAHRGRASATEAESETTATDTEQ